MRRIGKDAVGRRVHRQQRAHDVLVAGVLGLVDRLEHAVDLVGLEQHRRREEQGVLKPSPREAVAQAIRQPDLVEDARVDLARPVLAGRGVGQTQQVDVRAVVARVANLAAGKEA